jgi:hypothetical protein
MMTSLPQMGPGRCRAAIAERAANLASWDELGCDKHICSEHEACGAVVSAEVPSGLEYVRLLRRASRPRTPAKMPSTCTSLLSTFCKLFCSLRIAAPLAGSPAVGKKMCCAVNDDTRVFQWVVIDAAILVNPAPITKTPRVRRGVVKK